MPSPFPGMDPYIEDPKIWPDFHNVDTMQLVTAIAVLSPVNKRLGREAYTEYHPKRRDLLRSPVHLIELDLLRGGERMPLEKPVGSSAYVIMVSHAERRPLVKVWPLQLHDRLPVLPVPLFEPDPDVALDLGAAVAVVYERGGYASIIDYRQPPPLPHLSDAEARWRDDLLHQRGLQ